MPSTILSENQYDAKFIAAAKNRPNSIPWPPPSISPMTRNNPLMMPSRSVVLITFDICLFYAAIQPGDEGGHERGSVGQRVDLHVLVQRVRAVADRAQPVQRW